MPRSSAPDRAACRLPLIFPARFDAAPVADAGEPMGRSDRSALQDALQRGVVKMILLIGRLRYEARGGLLRVANGLDSLRLRPRLRAVPASYEAQVLADLEQEGVHVTRLERLVPEPAARDVLERARALIGVGSAQAWSSPWSRATNSIDLAPEVLIAQAPELYLLGLNERLLDLVQRYLRVPVAYHGAVLRHSLVDGEHAGARLWHQDGEDFHVLRMVVYLNDVAPGGGPFEYIPRSLGVRYADFGDARLPLTNDRMREVVPAEQWKRVFGPAGTVVLADTARVFHHESLQTQRERTVIMIG